MPICVKEGLPAIETLAREDIFIMTEKRATHQDIRVLNLLIVNLMPTVIATETQLLRLLSNTALQLNIEFLKISDQLTGDKTADHFKQFYHSFKEIKNNHYDGIIITGAPVEKQEFEAVAYWQELCDVLEWAKTHVFSSLYICWGAQAALYYHYGIKKSVPSAKISGVCAYDVNNRRHPIVRGFDDFFYAPHSHYTAIAREDVLTIPQLEILAESSEAGVYLISDITNRQLFVTGHCEYDRVTLKNEYIRDYLQGLKPDVPKNYQLKGELGISDQTTWSSHATLLFANWLNYYVYQQTPYHLKELSF